MSSEIRFSDLAPALGQVDALVASGTSRIRLSGLSGLALAIAIASVCDKPMRRILVVAPDKSRADQLVRELLFAGVGNLSAYPSWDSSPFSESSPDAETAGARLKVLKTLSAPGGATVVAPVSALMQKVMPRKVLSSASCRLTAGDDLDRDEFLLRLVRLGYHSASLVEEPGSFAVRGGIVDLFPPDMQRPARIELFGDNIETIRAFDPLSQRSLEPLDELLLLPSREILLAEEVIEAFLPRLKNRADELDITVDRRRAIAESIQLSEFPAGTDYLLPLFHPELETLFDYLGPCIEIIVDPDGVKEAAFQHSASLEQGVAAAVAAERLYPDPPTLYLQPEQFFENLSLNQLIEMAALALAGSASDIAAVEILSESNSNIRLAASGESARSIRPFVQQLEKMRDAGWRTVIAFHQNSQAERLRELISTYGLCPPSLVADGLPQAIAMTSSHPIVFALGEVSQGVRLPEARLAIIAEEELFGRRTRRKSGVTALRTKQIMASLAELKPGDYMVHLDHGIGLYRGLQHLKTGAVEGDFLLLEYSGSDRLYLPIDRLGLVQRYVGGEGAHPQVAKLGGTTWEKTRSKAKKAVEELAAELLEIYARRQASKGFAFSPPDEMFMEFEATFPWDETPDQLSAINDVLADMQHTRPMDRLVCGDVGYGKTEVALRAAFKAVLDGKQVAVLVPTTILAQQHFETFSGRLAGYPVTVEMLSRFRSAAEQKAILAKVAKGEVDIIIGTHRLLQKDVVFRDLGLLVVDEEQRFGVKDKDRLKKYRADVDIMTLTATPIPRTLHMSMMGIRDLSIIDTPPVDRQAIRTVVARDTDDLVREAVIRELGRDGQVFFVHNRVQSIGLVAERLRRIVPEASIAVAHGQMDEKELEKVMLGFMHGRTNLLLCTTIIESGLDIPRANTMIVDKADTYGLSQLYQLRGRIGRSSVRGEAYLLIQGAGGITREARERLKIIQEITELGAGFRIATHDLELRGAGDLLGPRQSGAVADIGFEYYNQLLEEAIAALKGEAHEDRCEPEINIAVPAFIPESYLPDTNQRLVMYKRMVQAVSAEEIEEIAGEIRDRYGRPPAAVDSLAEVMRLRITMKELKILKIDNDGKRLALTFHPATTVNPDLLVKLIRDEPRTFQFTPDHKLLVNLPPNMPTSDILAFAKECLGRIL